MLSSGSSRIATTKNWYVKFAFRHYFGTASFLLHLRQQAVVMGLGMLNLVRYNPSGLACK
jgi:hypothetical protein